MFSWQRATFSRGGANGTAKVSAVKLLRSERDEHIHPWLVVCMFWTRLILQNPQ